MKKIKLTQGKFAWVDDEDYEYLNQWKWHVKKDEKTFYAQRSIKRNGKWTTIKMHQVLAELMGITERMDHINRNGLDNCKNNLRPATHKQSAENRGMFKNNTSGYKGVCWYKRYLKWYAYIRHNDEQIYLGYFNKKEDAVKARKAAEKKYFTHT